MFLMTLANGRVYLTVTQPPTANRSLSFAPADGVFLGWYTTPKMQAFDPPAPGKFRCLCVSYLNDIYPFGGYVDETDPDCCTTTTSTTTTTTSTTTTASCI